VRSPVFVAPPPPPLFVGGGGGGGGEHATQVAVPSKKWARSASSPDIGMVGSLSSFGRGLG